MRMRRKKHTHERIIACGGLTVENPNDMRGVWGSMSRPVYLEIGCGKGDFVCGMAQKYPDVNFVAVEKIPDVIVTALEKAKELELPNVRFIINDAANLGEYFADGEVSGIYLNFSDPWKKRYQHGKRLTHLSFLDIYKKILKSGASIFFKTDNRDLFDFSIKSFNSNGFAVGNVTYDLHNSDFCKENIMTEYEKNFVSQNIPICRLEATLLR